MTDRRVNLQVRPLQAIAVGVLAMFVLAGCAKPDNFEKTADGIIVTPAQGPAKRVRLQVVSDRIVRVTAVPGESLQLPESLMVVAKPAADVKFSVARAGDKVVLKTARVTAEVALATGAVDFLDANGKPQLAERDRGTFEPVKADEKNLYRVHQLFNPGTDEAF